MTKLEMVTEIFAANPGLTRKEMIVLFVDGADMTPAGASTYYAKVNKASKQGTDPVTVTPEPKKQEETKATRPQMLVRQPKKVEKDVKYKPNNRTAEEVVRIAQEMADAVWEPESQLSLAG